MKGKVVFPARELDIAISAEVVVVGGGSAGIAAAVSAARNGARTLLLEQSGCCGGNYTSVATFSLKNALDHVEQFKK